jgi:hypothetical protein
MPQTNTLSQTDAAETLHFAWFGATTADWSALSSIATIIGVLIAVLGGYLALRSYRSANRMASHAHMHALFRDYLRTQFDFELGLISLGAGRDTAASRERLGRDVAPLKLYVLEEMWVWLSDQRRGRDEWRVARALSSRIRHRKWANDAWANTILSHIVTDMPAVLDNLRGATHCYSLDFLKFLADGLQEEDDEFRAMYEDQAEQVAERKKRAPYNRPRH